MPREVARIGRYRMPTFCDLLFLSSGRDWRGWGSWSNLLLWDANRCVQSLDTLNIPRRKASASGILVAAGVDSITSSGQQRKAIRARDHVRVRAIDHDRLVVEVIRHFEDAI